ncbi:MAG: hypothetical protein D6682_07765 [Zetaproteobacteria bacterium]|nr:MAG: hypothetical protein D6682_07765 [Zetaproteobacteria bacterium]
MSMVYMEDRRVMATMLPAARSVLRDPDAFFRGMPTTARYQLGILLLTAITMVSVFLAYPFYDALLMFLYPVIWVGTVVGTVVWAHYLSWGVRRFSDGRMAPTNAFLLSSYASVPLVAAWIPWLGTVAFFWSLYLMWRGVVVRSGMRPGVALALIGLPMILPVVLLLGLLIAFPQLRALVSA